MPLKAEKFDQFIDWDELSPAEVAELRRNIRDQGVVNEYSTLAEVKFLLLNGNKEIAKTVLQRVKSDEKGIVLIKKRLAALIHFIEEDFDKSLEILSSNDFSEESLYTQICMLKVMNLMFLEKRKLLYGEFSRCSNLTTKYSYNDHLWLETLLSLQVQEGIRRSLLNFTDSAYFKGFTSSLDKAILWLKMVIFLNKEKQAYPLLNLLPTNYYKSGRFREVLSFIYYRMENYELAEKLVEDLEGPNAENIRGNIRLKDQKYELAYGHFRLALKKKNNSINALERILPLAWILGKWDDGIRFLDYISEGQGNGRNKKIIKSVMLTRKEDFPQAIQIIENLFPVEAVGQPLKVNQLISYLGLLSNNESRSQQAALRACRQYDGLNCWLLFKLQQWKNFGKIITRENKISEYLPLSIEELKTRAQSSPIKEPVYINQEDIEELDERLVKINIDSEAK
jgi:hypothetical protein